jgi:hypothetical protein
MQTVESSKAPKSHRMAVIVEKCSVVASAAEKCGSGGVSQILMPRHEYESA